MHCLLRGLLMPHLGLLLLTQGLGRRRLTHCLRRGQLLMAHLRLLLLTHRLLWRLRLRWHLLMAQRLLPA